MKIKPSSYVLICLLVVLAVVIFSSLAMPYYESKLLPLIVGGITFVLSAVELWRELRAKDKIEELKQEKEAEIEGGSSHATIAAISWVVGTALGIYVLGFLVALALFIFAYLQQQKRRWQASILTAVITTSLVYVIFERILGFELYQGIIRELIIR